MRPFPRINDVATDLEDTPDIEGRREMRERFKPIIRKWYPKLQPLELDVSPADVFVVALHLAQSQKRWEITRTDPDQGVFQGVATTGVFKFKDDFVVRIRARGEGARVDMRSKSRIGVGDIGANYNRIMAFLKKLKARMAEETT